MGIRLCKIYAVICSPVIFMLYHLKDVIFIVRTVQHLLIVDASTNEMYATKGTSKHGPGFHEDVIKEVKPIFRDLTKEEELASKCLQGRKQNANESFNNMIWVRPSNANYCGLNTLKLSVYDAVVSFKHDGKATLDLTSVQKHGFYYYYYYYFFI